MEKLDKILKKFGITKVELGNLRIRADLGTITEKEKELLNRIQKERKDYE